MGMRRDGGNGVASMLNTSRVCRRCSGPLEARSVEHPYWNGINLVAVVQGVPSWVCMVCGYQFFDPSVDTTLRFIVKDYVKMGTTFPVPSTPYRKIIEQ
jgi:YgiT-type zinc finger domain-containing protein